MKQTLLTAAATLYIIGAAAQNTTDTTATELHTVDVTLVRRTDTEAAIVGQTRAATGVVSAVGGEEIRRAQDSNAGEAVRRVPGVSIIEDKFVMVRGLSQRYNNVWINGGAVPSSEADSRAFSFDLIPSAQIANLIIVKSPTPELPADFSGGFININTRDVPARDAFSFTLGTNLNLRTVGRTFTRKNWGDWLTRSHNALPDLRLATDWALRRRCASGTTFGLVGALNYTNERRRLAPMTNNLFGVYDQRRDRSNYLRRSTDHQYNLNQRLGGMLNLTMVSPSGNHKYELKNIVNFLTTDRFTRRQGISAQSNREASAEYYTRRRTTYNGQLTGRHTLGYDDVLDWQAAYSYANRRMPRRRRYLVDDALTDDGRLGLTSSNDINIEDTRLDEHIASAAVNHQHTFLFGQFEPRLRVGAYTEYRTRAYRTREQFFLWDAANNTLPADFRLMDMPTLLSSPQYRGPEGLYLYEEPHMRNDYDGRDALCAAYFAATLPLGRLRIYTGLRYEMNRMKLISNTRDYERSPHSRRYTSHDFLPSLNATLRLAPDHQLRLAYGRSLNRAEFRELSSSVYYDFDLNSDVQGNSELRPADIHNLDLRYEWYPARGELISLAAFYKHFRNPIEWTYTVAGGTDLVYSYENARSANNLGLELDIRKTLDFMGLRNFSLAANAAYIHSRVAFPSGSHNDDRPMQGQSPYLVNVGLFYHNEARRLTAAVLYNRIGKRIIGVGRSEGTTGSDELARIPDSYEMPRDVVDLTFAKGFGTHLELKASVRDVLGQKVTYQQYEHNARGNEIKQVTRQYRPGQNIALSLTYKL